MWTTILTVGMQLVGYIMKKKQADDEATLKFLELANHLQQRQLISAKFKFERDDRLEELRKKREAARNPETPS